MAINDKKGGVNSLHMKITNEYFGGDQGAEMKAHRETQMDFAVLWICMSETLQEFQEDPTIQIHQTFMNKINGFSSYLTSGINKSMNVLKGIKCCLGKPTGELNDVETFRNRFNKAYPLMHDSDGDGIWEPVEPVDSVDKNADKGVVSGQIDETDGNEVN